jgi:hypothetical protein
MTKPEHVRRESLSPAGRGQGEGAAPILEANPSPGRFAAGLSPEGRGGPCGIGATS